MKCSIILFIFLSVFVSNSITKLGNVRYCRNHVRRCSRHRFGLFITTKLNKTTSSNATAPGAEGATSGTGVTPSTASTTVAAGAKRRRKRDETPASPPAGESSPAAGESPPAAPGPAPAAGNGSGDAGAAPAPAETTPGTTTEPPSWPLPTPQIFTLTDLEETFYSCLDDLGVGKCKLYMAQRCNWHNGKSTVLANYCKKWGIPCKPCPQG